MRFYVKRPQSGENRKGKRKTYSIQSDSYKTIKSPALDAVNKRFLAGELTPAECERHIQKIIAELERKEGIFRAPSVFNNDNQKILDAYWEEEYSHRHLEDPDAAYGKLAQALRALGPVSILVGTQSEIQKQVNQFKGDKQRMIVGKVNALLEFVKRKHEVRLTKVRPVRPRVKYLNPQEFEAVMARMEDKPLELLCRVMFLSGMRLGEAFAVQPDRIKPDKKTVYVDSQLTRNGTTKGPKWQSERSVYLIRPCVDYIEQWAKVRGTVKGTRGALLKRFKKACRKAFPGRADKLCDFNSLRHSYAVQLLTSGVSMGLVSQSLGNTESVCQRHYAGFALNPDSVEAIDSIVSRQSKEK